MLIRLVLASGCPGPGVAKSFRNRRQGSGRDIYPARFFVRTTQPKAAFAAEHGTDELHRMRRGYRDRSAPLAADDPRYLRHRETYPDLEPALLPATESLADTRAPVALLERYDCTRHCGAANTCWSSHTEIRCGRSSCISRKWPRAGSNNLKSRPAPLIVEFAPDGNFLRRNYLDAPAAAPTNKTSG